MLPDAPPPPDASPDVASDGPPPAPFRDIAPCFSESDYTSGTTINTSSTLSYLPRCLKVKKGTAVKFVGDFRAHPTMPSTKRGDVAGNPIPFLVTGTEATVTFDRAGFFAYYCSVHGSEDTGAFMAGVVWVTDDGGVVPGGPGLLGLAPASRDFGSTAVNAVSGAFTFTVSNGGGQAITNLAVLLDGADFMAPLAGDKCLGITSLAPGASCTVDVQFAPKSRGFKSGTLLASGGGQTVTASLSGLGVSAPRLLISPAAQTLGGVAGQQGTAVTFTIVNAGDVATGTLAVVIAGADAPSFKLVTNGCLTPLAALGSCQVTLALHAMTPGNKTATLTASATPGGMAVATLTGVVLAPSSLSITPASAHFMSVSVGATSTAIDFTVRNSGGAPTAALTVTVGTDFVQATNTCSGGALAANGTCLVSVAFKPTSQGAKSALLTIHGGQGEMVSATLSGTGTN